LKKNLEKDLHRVTKHPADSARGCLSEEVLGGHQILHLKEKGIRTEFLRSLRIGKAQKRQHFGVQILCRGTEVTKFLEDSRVKLRGSIATLVSTEEILTMEVSMSREQHESTQEKMR